MQSSPSLLMTPVGSRPGAAGELPGDAAGICFIEGQTQVLLFIAIITGGIHN